MSRRYRYAEAAEALGCEESWLRRNVKKLPRTKVGRTVYFTDEDLTRIDQLFHIEPTTGPLAIAPPPSKDAGSHPLKRLRPLPPRRAAAHGD